MTEAQERWRKPGVRLAMVALIGVTVYFLVIFVKQSWNLFQLTREVYAKEARVAQLTAQNETLEQRLGQYMGEEGRRLLAEQHLPYVGPGEGVVVTVAESGQSPTVVVAPAANSEEALAALPTWQQWVMVVFTPLAP